MSKHRFNVQGRVIARMAVVAAVVLTAGLGGAAWAQSPFTGAWDGTVALPNGELTVQVVLDPTAEPPTGTIDIPAQGVAGFALEGVTTDGEAIEFMIAGIPGRPTFQGTLDDGRITGTFSQSGASFPFELAPAGAGDADDPDEIRFTDPEGRYSVPVPTNWTAEARDGHGVLTSPGGDIRVYTLALEATDTGDALARAWSIVEPEFDREIAQTLTPPAPAGIEAVELVTYETEPDRVVQAIARLRDGRVYVAIFTGRLAAIAERQSQVATIDSGFEITGVTAEDISDREARDLTPELVAELEAFIRDALERSDVPGLAISVVQDGEIVYANGFGVRELGADEPVTRDTLMMIGSTGKTMTTMLMATLVDDGAMRWDTPAARILPQFRVADPETTERITVRHLVCACTGVPRRDLEMIFHGDELTAEGVVESLADFRFFTEFGEAFQYSNQMVATGGYVAAAADGATYGELYEGWLRSMQERVFDPIGMSSTYVRFEDVLENENVATPHGMFLDMTFRPIDVAMERFVLPVAPAGAPWSTVMDMGRYLVTELSGGVAPDGTRVVSEANLHETWRPQVPMSADTDYALGWMIGSYKGLDLVMHGGNTFGFTSDLAFLPGEGIGVSILTNGRATDAVNEAIRTRLFELLYDLEPEAPAQLAFGLDAARQGYEAMSERLLEADPAELAPYLGTYTNAALGTIELRLEAGVPVLDAGEFAVELRSVAADGSAYVMAGPPFPGTGVTLELEGTERVVTLDGGTEPYRFTRD